MAMTTLALANGAPQLALDTPAAVKLAVGAVPAGPAMTRRLPSVVAA